MTSTWRQLRDNATGALGDALDAQRIIEAASGLNASELRLELDHNASDRAATHVDAMVQRRLSGVPLQHVVGRWGFRTLDVAVDPRALIPRPETEIVVEHAITELARLRSDHDVAAPLVVDLGTGSGVIALSIAVEVPTSTVFATERDPQALALARANLAGTGGFAAQHVMLFEGTWFAPIPDQYVGTVDVVISNPPYLANAEIDQLDSDVRDHDPHDALFAGETGYECYEQIAESLGRWLAPHGVVVLEHAPWQGARVREIVQSANTDWASVNTYPDLTGRDRVTVGRRAVV